MLHNQVSFTYPPRKARREALSTSTGSEPRLRWNLEAGGASASSSLSSSSWFPPRWNANGGAAIGSDLLRRISRSDVIPLGNKHRNGGTERRLPRTATALAGSTPGWGALERRRGAGSKSVSLRSRCSSSSLIFRSKYFGPLAYKS